MSGRDPETPENQQPPDAEWLPKSEEMQAFLDGFVMGQAPAKQVLATAVYNHYFDVGRRELAGLRYKGNHSQHILLLGPTGSGKSYMVRKLAKRLGVPFVTVSASTFSRTGYVGGQVDSILQQLYGVARNDIRAAQRGIVFIDEIDKIRRNVGGSGPDVSGEGVQIELLDLLGGRTVEIKTGPSSTEQIDVSRLLFIAAGSFGDLPQIVRARLESRTPKCFGFSCKGTEVSFERASDAELISQYTMQDLIDFGLIPELIGRFSSVVALDELGEDQLMEILDKSPESALRQQVALFKAHGIDLEFTEGARRAVARNARRMKTGARSLQRAVLRALDAVDWLPANLNDAGVVRIVFEEQHVETGALPRLLREKTVGGATELVEMTHAEFEALKNAPARPMRDRGARIRAGAFASLPRKKERAAPRTGPRPISDYSVTEPMFEPSADGASINQADPSLQQTYIEGLFGYAQLSPTDRALFSRMLVTLGTRKMIRLAHELVRMNALGSEFFDVARRFGTDSVRATMHFLAFEKLSGGKKH